MKKLALLFIILISFVGFAQQKAKPFENVDNERFQIVKHFLLDLDGVPVYGFMIMNFEDWDMGICLKGDSIIYRVYEKPILSWLYEYNNACDNGEEPLPPVLTAEYKLKIDSPKDFSAIAQFLQSIVDKATPFKEETPCVDGINWYVLANGKWAYIRTGSLQKAGAITDKLIHIASACENNDPANLTREALGLE